MSVDAGKVILRFEIDIRQFDNAVSKMNKGISDIKMSADGAKPSIENMGKAADKTGETAASTAIKFQTLTQGAINLTTSFTQAYTSISNLQRAKTSLQASAVAVERAEDALARTEYQLSKARKASHPDIDKINLLLNRQKTNSDALLVSQLRLKDETGRVSDTYVLFALNLINVSFSAIQTIKSMKDLAVGMDLVIIKSTILNAITSKWTLIALAAIAAYEGIIQVLKASGAEWASQYSIIDNVNRMMDTFGKATNIIMPNYGRQVRDAANSWDEFDRKEEQALSKSSVRMTRWITQKEIAFAKDQVLRQAAANSRFFGTPEDFQ